jgi:hypothetical protein
MKDRQKVREGRDAPRPGGHDHDSAGEREQSRGISPLNPSSMPRGEDDETTHANSPEYHDRAPNEPSKPQ